MKKMQLFCALLVFVTAVGLMDIKVRDYLLDEAVLYTFSDAETETDGFRNMRIGKDAFSEIEELSSEENVSQMELLASAFFDSDYNLESAHSLSENKLISSLKKKQQLKASELQILTETLTAVWADVKYFPVPVSSVNLSATVSFDNTWMSERTYGGERVHEGTDIMADINESGYYPVISMTDGTVENIGWLTLGGYRIGIRSPSGGYFYYAHLASYAKEFQAGDTVSAGDLLGMMGDTGYSEVEGTTGNFDVHLHVGIYIQTEYNEELSVNPYYVLKYLEERTVTYQY